MRNWERCLFFMLYAVLLSWAVIPIQSSSLNPIVAPTTPMTIQIGMLLPLTGTQSETGTTAQATLEVAIEDFQRAFPTVTIDAKIADTGSDPDTALAQLQNLAASGIRIFIGPFSSAEVLAVKTYVDQNRIVLISPTATATSLAVADTIFRISLDDAKQSIAIATLIVKRNVTTIVPIVRNDLYGTDFIAAFTAQFQTVGGTTVSPIFYDPATADYQSVIAQAKTSVESILQSNAGASIGVLAIAFDEIVNIFTAASTDTTLSSLPWFGTDSTAQSAKIASDAVASAFAEKIQFTASISSDYNVVSYPYLPFTPINETLITKVLARTPTLKSTKVAPTYDALWIAGMACFDPDASLEEEVVRISKESVGYMGSIYFGETGDRGYGWFAFYRFMNQKWVLNAAYVFTEFSTIPQPLTEYLFEFSTNDKVIQVGVLMALTGENSDYGQEMNTLLQKAKIDIDAILRRYYGANSRIEFVIEDTQTDPEVAYQKLVAMKEQGIQFVIGPTTSSELERVAPYANENGIILVSPSCTAMSSAQDDYIFRLTLNDEKHSASLATLMMVEGITHAEVIYREDTFGEGFKEYFTKAFTELGGTCGDGISYDPDTTDFQSLVNQAETVITNAGATYGYNKTAVLLISYDEVIPLLETISPNSILSQVRWFGTDGFTQNPEIIQSDLAKNFAAKTKLTASTSGTDVNAMLIYQLVMGYDLTDYLGAEARAYDIGAYDAAWFITQFSVFSDWYPSTTPLERVTYLKSIASMTASYVATNLLDANGDRTMGSIIFYQVQPTDSTADWIKYAAFVYYIGQSGPYYYEEGQTSHVLFAPMLK